MRYPRFQLLLAAIPIFLGTTAAVRSCQVTCVEYDLSGRPILLLDAGGHPLAKAKLVLRDASPSATGPTILCAKKGQVVRRIKSDRTGHINLKRVKPGRYWLTYMDKNHGQSFLIDINSTIPSDSEEAELAVARFDSNQCYLIDIERNTTFPPNWPAPLRK
jgi:hypothetical protein